MDISSSSYQPKQVSLNKIFTDEIEDDDSSRYNNELNHLMYWLSPWFWPSQVLGFIHSTILVYLFTYLESLHFTHVWLY